MTTEALPRVLVTGISGSLGQLVARQLQTRMHVIGVDKRPLPLTGKNIEHHQLDLRRKSAIKIIRDQKPDYILHLGVIRNPLKHKDAGQAYFFNLELTSQLLKLAESLPVKKFVYLSSANLYGPSIISSGFLTEDAALHGANRSPEIRDLVAIDMMIQSFFWKQPDIHTVILRPVHVVGAQLNNAPSRYLRLDTMPTILGHDPMIQMVHASDLVRAVTASLTRDVRGIFNIVGGGQAPLSRIGRGLNANLLPLPEYALRKFLEIAFRFSLTMYPPGELDHLKYTCLIDGARARQELGYKPLHSMKQIVDEMARVERRPFDLTKNWQDIGRIVRHNAIGAFFK